MAASSATEVPDGPVISYLNKRLRALRKKYNRILQMEESLAHGKLLNKEQEEVLRSKPAIAALIEEYERLRHPISSALKEELTLAQAQPPPSPTNSSECTEFALEDLLSLLYFGSLFDVKPQSDFTSTMLTRTHERECCLTYDYVTDDATDLLGEQDLDLISTLGGLLIARPLHSTLSHKNALRSCVEHAKLWLAGSDQLVQPGVTVTYAGLRQRLNKILASDYFTTAPEMRAPVDVAAAAGKYAPCQPPDEDKIVDEHPDEDAFDGSYHATEITDNEVKNDDANHPTSFVEPPKESLLQCPDQDVIAYQEQSISPADSEGQIDNEAERKEYAPRRSYYNQRVSGRGGGRRGYGNGRGGRRGGGSQNGRNQYYDSMGYYPRNYYNSRGRSGGRSLYNYGGYTHAAYGYSAAEVEPGRS